jgi:hypothetical protein
LGGSILGFHTDGHPQSDQVLSCETAMGQHIRRLREVIDGTAAADAGTGAPA